MLCWIQSDSLFTPHLSTSWLTQMLQLVATELFRKPLVTTRLNEKETSGGTGFSSFPKSKRLLNEYMMKCAWNVRIIFLFFFVFYDTYKHSMNFPNVYYLFFYFSIKEMNHTCQMRFRCGKKHFDIHFWRNRPVQFLLKDGKDASFGEEKDDKVFISRQSRHFSFWYCIL